MSSKGVMDIEFILSVFVFVSTVSFVLITVVIGNMPLLQQLSASEDMRARGYQISEKLFFTEGEPKNWKYDNVNSLGLLSGTFYNMSIEKMENLSLLCKNDYNRVKELLGLNYMNDLVINVTYIGGEEIFSCKRGVGTKRVEVRIDRYGIANNVPVRMSISIS